MIPRYLLVLSLLTAACSANSADPTATTEPPGSTTTSPNSTTTTQPTEPSVFPAGPIDSRGNTIPPAPTVPTTELSDEAITAIDRVWGSLESVATEDILAIGSTGDPRLGWLLADLMSFVPRLAAWRAIVEAFNELAGTEISPLFPDAPWRTMTDHMIAWDLEAPPSYADYKRQLFTLIEPAWEAFFEEDNRTIDWRLISWGGVFIDDRELGDLGPCDQGCIAALDDPPVTDAAGGDWYPDNRIVFAVEINGEARAYPKNMMEVHEMVNDTVGGRRIGMPYCTLCGAAQAFLTDEVPEGAEPYVLRTSGLLSRSNKVMYELNSQSMFDTFRGRALTGPLADAGVELNQVAVVTTTWGEWKAEHPETTIVAEDGGRGRDYPADPLQGRDDAGPIFPVGEVDPRLPAQELVLGVFAPTGEALAFPVEAAQQGLQRGDAVTLAGVTLVRDGGGLRAIGPGGEELPSHQAFWFAWSQFTPDTWLWQP
ncbi:MAG: DUF3179 domain-containing (seleno)protein [Acidimicrobiia bacterium]|nr:DUF3179 domain-containing (seleno)protein [Acidimicrobiia bacterium]